MIRHAAKIDPKQAHVVAQWPAGRPIVCCRFEPEGPFPFLRARKLRPSSVSTWPTARRSPSRAGTIPGSSRWRSLRTARRLLQRRRRRSSCSSGRRPPPRPNRSGRSRPTKAGSAPSPSAPTASCSPPAATTGSSALGYRRPVSWIRELTGHAGHIYSLEYHSEWQDPPERRSSWCDQGVGSDLRSSARRTFDAKALHTYEGGQQVDFGGVRGMAIAPDQSRHRRRRPAQGDEPAGRRARADRPGLRHKDPKAREDPADRRHHRRRDLAAALPGRRQL